MKKLFIVLAFPVLTLACECMGDITGGFMNMQTNIGTEIQEQTTAITSKLIPQIKQNTADIRKQNEQLKLAIKKEVLIAKQKTEIIFLLKKVNKIK